VIGYEIVRATSSCHRHRLIGHAAILGGVVVTSVAANVVALALTGRLSMLVTHYTQFVGSNASLSLVFAQAWYALPFPMILLAVAGMVYTAPRMRSPEWLMVHCALLVYAAFTFNYTFYLRLLAPLSVFAIIYAATLVGECARARPRLAWAVLLATSVAVLIVNSARDLPKYVVSAFGGYSHASAFLNRLDAAAPVLMVTQRHVWSALARPVVYLPSSPPTELRLASSTENVYVVTDIFALYKYSGRAYVPFMRSHRDALIARFTNSLPYDVVENNLTLTELRRLDHDPLLQDDVFSIFVFQISADDARANLVRSGAAVLR
jgi:hypothetical protein